MIDQVIEWIRRKPAQCGSMEARRLFHGRGRAFEGLEFLTVDYYPPLLMIILYQEVSEVWVGELAEKLQTELGDEVSSVLVQRRYLPGAPSEVVVGTLPEPCVAWENGLQYAIRPTAAQNIGFFPDMKAGRAFVRGLSAGRRVLNLFSYTCSFSVAAIRGGAEQVVNLDMSRNALDIGRQNHRLNDLDLRKAQFLAHNLFKSFGKLQKMGPFDLVVIDPPANQGGSFQAERDWPKMIRRLPSLVAPGGDVLACLNSPFVPSNVVPELFKKECPEAVLQGSVPVGDGFPEKDEDRGLRLYHYRF